MTVSFGDLTLDTDTRQIRRGAVAVHISPKAFELLTALVDARPRALSKADLHERLWPDTYVTESNLAGLVAEIGAPSATMREHRGSCGPCSASAMRLPATSPRGARRRKPRSSAGSFTATATGASPMASM